MDLGIVTYSARVNQRCSLYALNPRYHEPIRRWIEARDAMMITLDTKA